MSVPIFSSRKPVEQMSEQELADYVAGLQAFAEVKPEAISKINIALDTIVEVAQTAGLDAVATQATQSRGALSKGLIK